MEHTREILTFQFGTYANYVGAHFWNQQEANFVYESESESSNVAEDHLPQNDILYREGLNDRKQPTFTPRLLSVDLVGTLVHLPVVGELYGNYLPVATEQTAEELQKAKELAEQNELSTHGELDVRQQPVVPISEYQKDLMKNAVNMHDKDYNLSETCSSWADFLYARYHPRTFNVLQGMLKQPDVQVLGTHCAGVELWQSPAFNEDFCDRIRLYAEECNGLQGFQVIFDIDDGFSGLASKCMEHLNDEYSRAIFAVPLHYPRNMSYAKADPRTARNIRVVNSVLSYKHLSEQANLFTPLSTLDTIWRNQTLESRQMPGVHWKSDNLYQTSALLAAYLDTVTLGYRLRQTPNTLLDFCQRVSPSSRKMSAAAMALPLGMQHEQDLIDFLDGADGSLMTQLTPGCEPDTTHVVQSVSARGIPLARLKRPLEQAGSQVSKAAYRCNSVSQMLQLYYQCAYHGSFTHASSTPLPLKTHLPFPYEIFNETIATDGFKVPSNGHREQNTRVDSAPVLASVQNSSKLGTHLDSLHDQTHRVQLPKLRNYSHVALERDEYEAALDRLLEFRDNYEDSHYL